MLSRVLDRVLSATLVDTVVLATTSETIDDPVAASAAAWGFEVFRGSPDDVLDRYYQAARLHGASQIVRVTADCPLVSPQLIDQTIRTALDSGADYTSNARPVSTFPEGLDVEVFTFAALERAWREASLPSEREHVTPYIWKQPGEFTIATLSCPRAFPRVRLTVDEPIDLEYMRALFRNVEAGEMLWDDLVEWAATHQDRLPWNTAIPRDAGYHTSIAADPTFAPPHSGAANERFRPGRVVAIVQARYGASRLPGKTVAEICGATLLEHVLDRARACRRIDEVVLATTTEPADRQLISLAARLGVAAFAGSMDDVLDRYYQAARRFHAATIVRITADDPFKDPDVVDQVIAAFAAEPLDYASNTIQPTFPEGLDVEVFSFAALERAWSEATLRSDREHVTPYIWRQPDRFRLLNVVLDRDLSALRWTIDYEQDLRFARAVYAELQPDPLFHMGEVLDLLERRPELARMNTGIERNAGYQLSLQQECS
jgi:spore coat polysaccharide biosynthesis protein SpsF